MLPEIQNDIVFWNFFNFLIFYVYTYSVHFIFLEVIVWEIKSFEVILMLPKQLRGRFWSNVIFVPWTEFSMVDLLGLLSVLSYVAIVKIICRSIDGHATFSFWNLKFTTSHIAAERSSIRSYFMIYYDLLSCSMTTFLTFCST